MSIVALLLSLPLLQDDPASQWPHLRGPAYDGKTSAGVFPEGDYSLEPIWKAHLGPAYSGAVIQSGRVVTSYSNDEIDGVACLDADDGRVLWRRELGPVYRGHDGSEDGPIATPTIRDGSVAVVDARGRLQVLELESGAPRWEKDLVTEVGTVVPEYGYTSTPVIEDQRVIVQAGGSDGRLLCAFDLGTGDLLWKAGRGDASYASPTVLDLAGTRQVVVLNGKQLLGVEPDSGRVLWEHDLIGRDSATSGFATKVDENTFLVRVSGQQVLFSIDSGVRGFLVEVKTRLRDLGRTYAAPVVHEGHLYGFTSDFLTCVSLATGKRVWKSRPPGGRGLALVDDRLIVFGAEGHAVVVRATPEGYQEEANLAVLERNGYAWPAFAGGRMYLRSSEGLACVGISNRSSGVASADGRARFDGASALHEELAELETRADSRSALGSFLDGLDAFPHVEPHWGSADLVSFFWQGQAEDVALLSPLLEGNQVQPMTRLGESDVWFTWAHLEPRARSEYRFQIDYDSRIADPRNPRQGPATWGDQPVSIVTGSEYRAESAPIGGSGDGSGLQEHEFASPSLENTRKVRVWLPEESSGPLPVVLVQQGSDWLERGQLEPLLRTLAADGETRPCAVVFIDTINAWWYEAGGTGTEEYLAMLAEELLPFLRERHPLSDRREDVLLVGKEGFGLSAVYGALLHPETFGGAAALSVALGDRARHALFARIQGGQAPDVKLWIGWNRYEQRSTDRGYDHALESQRLANALAENGFAVRSAVANDSFGWTGWRARMPEILRAYFPQ